MKCSVYDSRGAQHEAECTSAGTSSSQSFSYSGYQYGSPRPGGVGKPPSAGSGLIRQPTNPSSFTQRSSSAIAVSSGSSGPCGSPATPM